MHIKDDGVDEVVYILYSDLNQWMLSFQHFLFIDVNADVGHWSKM